MFGEAGIDLIGALESAHLRVSGSITDVVRKSGRRAGVFDIVTFVLEVRDSDQLVRRLDELVRVPRRDEARPDGSGPDAGGAP